MPLISIIIPVYDVSKYLKRCLDSVVNQTLKNIEIILINDHSPDHADDIICQEYASADSRIKYIKLDENTGLGSVRNIGIDKANGLYQWHIDSDDFIDIYACEFLYGTATKNDIDILTFAACNFTLSDDDKISYYDEYFSRQKGVCNKILSGVDFLREARSKGVFYSAMWLNLIKSSFIKKLSEKIKFRSNCAYQDTDYTPIMFSEAKSVLCMQYTPYYRLIRNTSITGSEVTKEKLIDLFSVTESLIKYMEKHNIRMPHPLAEFTCKDYDYFKKKYVKEFIAYLNSLQPIIDSLDTKVGRLKGNKNLVLFGGNNTPQYRYLHDLSVMVKTFLRPDMLRRFLDSLGKYQEYHKVVFRNVLIGDDSSLPLAKENESAILEIKEKYPHLNIFYQRFEFNIGCSEGRNRLIDSIESKYFLYCDDDYFFEIECNIDNCLAIIEKEQVDILGGWCNNFDLNNDSTPLCFSGYFFENPDKIICNIHTDSFPEFKYYDYLTNFYIGNTVRIKQLKWDSQLKTEEHPDFFYRAFKQGYRMAFTNKLFIGHHHPKNNNYDKFRNVEKDGSTFLYLRVKKAEVKEWIANYYGKNSFRQWRVNEDTRSNNTLRIHLKRPIYNQRISVKRLSPKYSNFFFGYFDIISSSNEKYLALRIANINELPKQGDSADVCLIDENQQVVLLDKTTAWCFQQGNFLQFNPTNQNQVIYNIFVEADGEYKSVVLDLKTKEKRINPLPISNVSPNGDFALSINFSRLYDYRPGYGYCNMPDPFENEIHPKEDGVFQMDIETGEIKLLISYYYLWELFAKGTKRENDKIIVNHINYNTDGSKFIMLLRWFSESAPWPTLTLIADEDGRNIKKVFGFGSHYHWKDERNLIISGFDAVEKGNMGAMTLYELNVDSGMSKPIDPDFFIGDGHCSYSPDRNFVLYDSYASKTFPYRKLLFYDLKKKKGINLGYFSADPALYNNIADCRCDLHPRWTPDGQHISFDSIHEGYRGIYQINVSDIILEMGKDIEELSVLDIKKLLRSENKNDSLIHEDKWYRFGKYPRKRKIWVIGKVISKKLHCYPYLKRIVDYSRK